MTAEEVLLKAFQGTEWYKTNAASFFEEHPTAHKAIIQAMHTYAESVKAGEYERGWNDALNELEDNGFINDVIKQRHWQPLPPKPGKE